MVLPLLGKVFRGQYGERDVAVKRIDKKKLDQDANKRELQREEQALEILAHENVMMLYHVREEGSYR